MPAAAPGHRFGARRILLAEDDAINREVMLALLNHRGLAVDVATDGIEAVEHAQSTAYDLILMDVQMPLLDGLQAARRIRGLSDGRDVPIIAFTARAFAEDHQSCIDAGMNDVIAKPVRPDALNAVLDRWLGVDPSPPAH